MIFSEFCDYVAEHVTKEMGEDYTYSLMNVNKNNGLKLTGLSVRKKGSNVTPTFYLEDHYTRSQEGTSLSDVIASLVKGFELYGIEDEPDLDFLNDYESVAGKVMFKVVNYARNEEFLKTVPFRRFIDLAIVFYIRIDTGAFSTGSVVVTNEMLTRWNIGEERLYDDAYANTRDKLGIRLENIEAVLDEFMKKSGVSGDECARPAPETACEYSIPMYVLSNDSRYFGASCMLYDEVLDEFSHKMGSDLFILPSSVHELIIIPDLNHEDPDHLIGIVRDVNDTQLEPVEILSDNIYRYSLNDGCLEGLFA